MFCFRGYVAMRSIISIWGAFVGFAFGAGLIAGVGDDGFLRTSLAWFVGFVFALIFAAFAYFYYEISIIIAMSSIGFALGAGVMVAANVSWTWLIVLVGVVVGTLLAILAIRSDLPGTLLILLSAMGGASATVFGTMLLFGATNTIEYADAAAPQQVDDDWWWYAMYVGLVIVGAIVQAKSLRNLRATMRENWASGQMI
jgi:hypothetical protein